MAPPLDEITKASLDRARIGEDTDVTPQSASIREEVQEVQAVNSHEEDGLSRLERIKTHFGDRPECFKNTFQEVSFVFQATVATATTSFLTGVALIITVPVSRDLGMTQGEIAWISASTRYEESISPSFYSTVLIVILVWSPELSSLPWGNWQIYSAVKQCS